MEDTGHERQQLLRRALMANASFSAISGLVLVLPNGGSCSFSVCRTRST
jgi:hypothetical protein